MSLLVPDECYLVLYEKKIQPKIKTIQLFIRDQYSHLAVKAPHLNDDRNPPLTLENIEANWCHNMIPDVILPYANSSHVHCESKKCPDGT